MADCHLFNPSTEIALGLDSASFTPSAAVRRFERNLMLLPALYAQEGEAIMLTYPVTYEELSALPYFDIAHKKDIKFIKAGERIPPGCRLVPWGWNRATAARAAKSGFLCDAIPSSEYIGLIRKFAHRSTTIELWKHMQANLDISANEIPREAHSITEAMEIIGDDCRAFVAKAPWSSSGRGVFFTSSLQEAILTRRIDDIIRHYGSILLEPAWEKSIDFATEWCYDGGQLNYMGISVFKSSETGNYSGNIISSQNDLLDIVADSCGKELLLKTIDLQRKALLATLAPLFRAHNRQPALPPLFFGIDMLADRRKHLNPCVELNLRRTMGHVAIDLFAASKSNFTFIPGKPVDAEQTMLDYPQTFL